MWLSWHLSSSCLWPSLRPKVNVFYSSICTHLISLSSRHCCRWLVETDPFSFVLTLFLSGWALTLLSQDCLSYASTCQTIGLNTGFFASFTVFLAFNSEAFAWVSLSRTGDQFRPFVSHRWGLPQLTLAAYLRFWSIMCYAVTLWLLIFKQEVSDKLHSD